MSTTDSPPIEMQKVNVSQFWNHLDRWHLVTSESQMMPIENTGGFYRQTGYFSVSEVIGHRMVKNDTNLLAAIRKSPTKSDGKREMGYFINVNARPECL